MNAVNIVSALLEDDADIDPKDYALDKANPKWVYHEIVFMQGEDATEPLRLLDDEGADEAIKYLAQWDYGGENEHSPKTERPWGDADRVYHTPAPDGQTYFLTWNTGLGYIGLVRGKRHLYGLPD